MVRSSQFLRYRGDGSVPPGCTPVTRGEIGSYVADDRLRLAVNTALAVEQPLLVTGEPGTGKTTLAWSVASELGLGEVLEFHTRSDHQARDVLYMYDHLLRFHHAQLNDPRAARPAEYVRYRALGLAIRSSTKRVVLIDEIDKAPRDFPNDLLDEIDRMAFSIGETEETFSASHRPLVIITSNSERQLPDPFLRRCVFHYIEPPTGEHLLRILNERLSYLELPQKLARAAIERYQQVREVQGIEKKPATSELTAWVRVLLLAGVEAEELSRCGLEGLPVIGALLKSRGDVELITRSNSLNR